MFRARGARQKRQPPESSCDLGCATRTSTKQVVVGDAVAARCADRHLQLRVSEDNLEKLGKLC
jgi:hypothetical protein